MFHDDVVIKEVVACRLQCLKLFLLPVRLPDKLMPALAASSVIESGIILSTHVSK